MKESWHETVRTRTTVRHGMIIREPREPSFFVYAAVAVFAVLAICFAVGRDTPYLFDGSDLMFRVPGTIAIFLSVLLALIWYLARYVGRTRQRPNKAAIIGLFVFPSAIAGLFYWWSGEAVAVLARATGKQQADESFEVVRVRRHSGPICSRYHDGWYIDLRRTADGKVVVLRQCIYPDHIRPAVLAGSTICARMRSSVFGSIVDSYTRGACGPHFEPSPGFDPARDSGRFEALPTEPQRGVWTAAPDR